MRKLFAALGALLILWSLYAVYQVPAGTQAVTRAGDALPDIREETCAVHAIAPNIVLSDGQNQADCALYAINGRYTEFYPLFLLSGRLFYADEAQRGGDVCLIEERLAIKLFRTGEASDKTLTIGEKSYRVVGVVRDATDVGSPSSCRAYVPYEGAKAAFETIVRTDTAFDETPDGHVISLKKEKIRATLLARVTAFYLGASVLMILTRRLRDYGNKQMARYRAALAEKYPSQLFLKAFPRALFIVLCWLGALVSAYALLALLVAPAYAFPEWVPEVLVEWTSITDMFWKNMREGGAAVLLRTQELLRLNHWGYVCNIGCVMVLLSIGRLQKKCKKQND